MSTSNKTNKLPKELKSELDYIWECMYPDYTENPDAEPIEITVEDIKDLVTKIKDYPEAVRSLCRGLVSAKRVDLFPPLVDFLGSTLDFWDFYKHSDYIFGRGDGVWLTNLFALNFPVEHVMPHLLKPASSLCDPEMNSKFDEILFSLYRWRSLAISNIASYKDSVNHADTSIETITILRKKINEAEAESDAILKCEHRLRELGKLICPSKTRYNFTSDTE